MGIQINGSNDTIQADDGSLSLAGSVSYEDVTNVTSVGLSTFSSGIHIDDSITHLGDTDTKIRFPEADNFTVECAGNERFRIKPTNDIAVFTGSNSGSLTIRNDVSNEVQIHSGSSDALIFGTGGENERLRIDSSGRLLLGTTTEGAVNADTLTVAESGDSGITIRSGSVNAGSLFFSDSTSGTAEYAGYLQYDHSSNELAVGTASAERLRIDSSGRLLVGTSSSRSVLSSGSPGLVQIETQGNTSWPLTLMANRNDQFGPILALAKSRGTTAGSQTIVQSGDVLGQISFGGADGSDEIAGALIQVAVDGTPGANDMPGRLVFSTSSDGSSSPTERLRIDSSGRMLVGTTSASTQSGISAAKLQVLGGLLVGTDNAGTNGSGYIAFASACNSPSDSRPVIYHHQGVGLSLKSDANISFEVGADEKARIDSSGRLLIGHTSSRGVGSGTQGDLQVEANGPQIAASIVNNYNSTTGGILSLGHSRSSNPGGVTILQSGDELGELRFAGADGTDLFSLGATIAGVVDGTPGDNDMPGRLVFSTTADGASSPTERMRIDSSGRLLVGTTSCTPAFAAVFQGNSAGTDPGVICVARDSSSLSDDNILGALDFSDGNKLRSARIAAHRDGGTWTSQSSQPTYLAFSTTADGASSTTERMRIDNRGLTKFSLNGTSSYVYMHNSDTTAGHVIQVIRGGTSNTSDTTTHMIRFQRNDGTEIGKIRRGGFSAVAFDTTSDYRLKTNVVSLTGAIDRVKSFNPVRFNWIEDTSDNPTVVDGFLAHEAQTVVPEAVSGTKDEVDDDGNAVIQGIDQSKLVPVLTAALQEAIAKIETLEAKVAALEAG